MQYKTIVLELLKERTELHEQLRLTRRLLPTMETCARELKASHEIWKETLARANPGSDPIQIASEALELALNELENVPQLWYRVDRVHHRLDESARRDVECAKSLGQRRCSRREDVRERAHRRYRCGAGRRRTFRPAVRNRTSPAGRWGRRAAG